MRGTKYALAAVALFASLAPLHAQTWPSLGGPVPAQTYASSEEQQPPLGPNNQGLRLVPMSAYSSYSPGAGGGSPDWLPDAPEGGGIQWSGGAVRPYYREELVGFSFGPPGGPAQDVNLEFEAMFAMSLELQIMFDDEVVGRIGYWSTESSSSTPLLATNTSGALLFASAMPLDTFLITSPGGFIFDFPTVEIFAGRPLPPFPFTGSSDFGTPDLMQFEGRMRLQVADAEATAALDGGPILLAFGAGARYSRITHGFRGIRRNAGGSRFLAGYDPFRLDILDAQMDVNEDVTVLEYDSTYNGFGPLGSFSAAAPVGDGVILYGTVRGAVLFGHRNEKAVLVTHQDLHMFDIARDTVPSDLFFIGTESRDNSRDKFVIIPMAEAEVGVEIQFGGPYLRIAAVAQYWLNGGSAVDPGDDLMFFGGMASFGVNF